MITPVLLCGGSGSRLWPLSRNSYPKQFVPLFGEQTLFQAAALRFHDPRFNRPVVVTASDFRFIVSEQLSHVGVEPGTVLIEPDGRNTAPAVLAAVIAVMRSDPDAVLLVAPSDHVIPSASAFRDAVDRAMGAVSEGKIATFGIVPDRAETAYGYLELSSDPTPDHAPVDLLRFLEKPDAERAAALVADGRYLWNSGVFLFRAKDMLSAFEAYAPSLIPPTQAAVESAKNDIGFLRLEPEAWNRLEDISIDYAIMEHAKNLVAVPYTEGWSDLGGWDAIWAHAGPDKQGVAAQGNATALDCRNTLLRSDSANLEIVGIGLENVIAVAMNDAVLVADMSRAQDVKRAVTALKEKDVPQATQFSKDHRPWGWFESLAVGTRFQVKRIHVHPGASLSLQNHMHRSEHWIVVEGTARVTIDGKIQLVTENESIYVPLGAVHRLENPGKIPMVLIEVQTGSYVGEDDITRFEDVYARAQGAKG